MIAIIDFGSGNLRSVQKAFERIGAKAIITQNSKEIKNAEKVVLPGVGAMGAAMNKLTSLNLVDPIKDTIQSGKPFLGICLGLQLLFEESDEGGATKGLGLIPGRVKQFSQLKVPHMGWNEISIKNKDCPIFSQIKDGSFVYFCHSFYVEPSDKAIAATTTDYGIEFTSSVNKDNLYGVQFHPEKSQSVGLAMLKNFTEISA